MPKTDPRVVAYGVVDELNSQLGVVLAGDVPDAMRRVLERIQNELFDLGADVSLPAGKDGAARRGLAGRGARGGLRRFNARAPEPLKSFVLPGGTETAARLHVARTVCRRAELEALRAPDLNPAVHAYLNRLSDLLFILARAANADAGEDEPLWKPGSSQ